MAIDNSILILDTYFLSKIGLTTLLSENQNYTIYNQVSNHAELVEFINFKTPDLVIMDYLQEYLFGVKSLDLILKKSPGTRIMVISNDKNHTNIQEVIERGIHSYVTRNCGKEEIILAVRNTLKGDRFFCNKVLNVILSKNKTSTNGKENVNKYSNITAREKEILVEIAKAKNAKEISADLNISIHTIYTHRKNLMKKLNLKSPVELIMLAMDLHQNELKNS